MFLKNIKILPKKSQIMNKSNIYFNLIFLIEKLNLKFCRYEFIKYLK